MMYILGTYKEGKKTFIVLEEVGSDWQPVGDKLEFEDLELRNAILHTSPTGQLIVETDLKQKKKSSGQGSELDANQ